MFIFLVAQAIIVPPAPSTRFYQSNRPLPSAERSCAELRKAAAKQKPGRNLGNGWSAGAMQVDCKARSVRMDKVIAHPSTQEEAGWQAGFQRDIDYVCHDWFIGGLIRQGWQFRTRTRFADKSYTFLARCPQRR